MTEVGPGVVAATLGRLRECGAGRRECVAYWVASSTGDTVSRVVHPPHDATWSGYEVQDAWLTEFFLDLGRRNERVVAQVHTHPHRWVEMSATDDRYVLLPTAGFVSAVVPDFAASDDVTAWGLWVLEADGTWSDGAERITWTTD